MQEGDLNFVVIKQKAIAFSAKTLGANYNVFLPSAYPVVGLASQQVDVAVVAIDDTNLTSNAAQTIADVLNREIHVFHALITGLPSHEDLQRYSVVYFWAKRRSGDPKFDGNEVGNYLATFVDNGGNVVYCHSDLIVKGRWIQDGYVPVKMTTSAIVPAYQGGIVAIQADQGQPQTSASVFGPMWINECSMQTAGECLAKWPRSEIPLLARKRNCSTPAATRGASKKAGSTVVFLNAYLPSQECVRVGQGIDSSLFWNPACCDTRTLVSLSFRAANASTASTRIESMV